MVLIHKTKEEEGEKHKTKKKTQKKHQIFRMKSRHDRFRMFGPHSKPISVVLAWFKADFGLFWSPANTTQCSRCSLIQAESVWFSANRAESVRIRGKKKKKNSDAAVMRGQRRWMLHPASNSSAAPSQPHWCFRDHK